MPTMVDAAGRRKVRCPKCTVVLTEPETQIYECPVCFTLLLAKGTPGGKLWEDKVHRSDGDADVHKILEAGSKLPQATLIDESVQQSAANVGNLGFDGRRRSSQELSDLDNQSLSGMLSNVKTQPVNDSALKNNALAPDTPPDSPRRRKSLHAGDISPRGESGQQSAELDSASHSESEVDSSLCSSEVFSTVSSFEASNLVAGSSEHSTTSRPSISSGAAVNDGTKILQEESELEMRKSPDTRPSARHAEEETAREEWHHPHEVALAHEERQYLESTDWNPDVPVITSSGKSAPEGGHKTKDKRNDDDSFKSVTGSQSPQRNMVNSRPKERVSTDSKQQKDVDIPKLGKFGLFDLSVFGIYNEDTYSELRRGKAAHYTKLSGSSSDGEDVQSTVYSDSQSHSYDIATHSSSYQQDPAENCMVETIAGVQNYVVENIADVANISDIPESITDGTHIEAGSSDEVLSKDREQDRNARSSGSVGQEVDDDGDVSDGDEGLAANTSVDSDVLANARYGDHLDVREISVGMGSSQDISFGDWRLQPDVKPPQIHADTGSIYARGMRDVAAGEGSDSSWDDEEELTFSSTVNEESKLKETSGTDKELQASRVSRRSIGRSQAKSLLENPALPVRTTAMQKFLLQRNEQEGVVQTHPQESIKADLELYEASYVEHYAPPLENSVHEAADQRRTLMPESSADDAPYIREDKPQGRPIQEESVDIETKVMERRLDNPFSVHSMGIAKIENDAVPPPSVSREKEDVQGALPRRDLATSEETMSLPPLSRKEKDVQKTVVEDPVSRKGFDAVRSPQRDVGLNHADRPGMEVTDFNSQNIDYFKHGYANKVGGAPGKPASLKWKGKASSTQSLSSTEDERAYGMESEAGSGPDRDYTRKQGVGLTERHGLPDRETQLGLGQPTRGHYQPAQRTLLSSADRPKHGSGELAGSRRSARSRGANARLANQESFDQADSGTIPSLEAFGRSAGLGMSENVPALQSPAAKLNRSMLDQGSNYSYNGTSDYNSDHSSRSQDAPSSRPHYNDMYLPNLYSLPAGGGAQAYPLSSHGSIPRAPLQEAGFTHPAHHCLSPACSLCMQQQYYMQPPQMMQNVMMHPCAACASQSSAGGYHQPLHHGAHSHHLHGPAYSNPSLSKHDSGSLRGHSQRQNRSNIHQSHPLPPTKRSKLYPPLPWKDAAPYVLCKHCNQLLQVPGNLPPTSEPIQKLQCGSCDKISKFSVHVQAVSPPPNRTPWASSGGLTMHASENLLARDKRHADTTSMHSSDWISSSGLAIPAQNSYRTSRHTSRHGSQQQEWVENRVFLQSSASGNSQTANVGLRHHARPVTSGVPEQYSRHGGNVGGEHFHDNTGTYSEGYLSSTPSSPSGSSPGRPPQRSRQHQQVELVQQRISGFGERKSTSGSPALRTSIHEQGRPSFEAPSVSDGFFERGPNENRSRYSPTSRQGFVHDPYSDSPRKENLGRLRKENLDRLQQASKAGSWHNQPADADYSNSRKSPAAPGSPLIEHSTQDTDDDAPIDAGERFRERERPPLPSQDSSKGSKAFAGLFKRSTRGGQGGNTRRKVIVNGHLISEGAVRKAEERAGPIHSGSYWYDYQAGFWGVMGGPCSGILMPSIEEFHFPLARDCAGGTTGILVNGRELHEKDLEVLVKRGMPSRPGKAYLLDLSGALLDDVTGQPLRGLGKLAPSLEKKGRGFGMSQFTMQS